MPNLVFETAFVIAEIAHVEQAGAYTSHLYGDPVGPGFLLVGDQGVYLMGNDPNRKQADGSYRPVVYAKGTDPKKDEDWWEAKRSLFGGDDGADFLDLKGVKAWAERALALGAKTITIELTPNSLTLVS